MSKYELKIVHLYPEEMNIYGDKGNIIALQKRAEWRDIKVKVEAINKSTSTFPQADIYFMGGGQDNDMYKIADDLLLKKAAFIKQEVDLGKVFLLVCGAFQLFGESFIGADGNDIKGLGIIPVNTKAPGNLLTDRCLGNIVTELTDATYQQIKTLNPNAEKTVVGFENHSGQTIFNSDHLNLTSVLYGKGNNSTEKKEGARVKNIFGSYTHGSLLPKNPHLADYLLWLALKNKYKDFVLEPLNDEIEWEAHKSIRRRLLGF